MAFLYEERLSLPASANCSDAASERKACQRQRQVHRNSLLRGRADEGQRDCRTTERVEDSRRSLSRVQGQAAAENATSGRSESARATDARAAATVLCNASYVCTHSRAT